MLKWLDFFIIHRERFLLITGKNKDTFRELFFEQLKKKISASYIFDIKREGTFLEFKGTVARHVWNGWNPFNSVTKARFRMTLHGHIPILHVEYNFLEIFVSLLLLALSSFSAFYQGSNGWGIAIILAAALIYVVTRFIAMARMASLAEEIRYKINNPDKEMLSFYETFKDDLEFVNEVFLSSRRVAPAS